MIISRSGRRSVSHAPVERLARMKRRNARALGLDELRHNGFFSLKRHLTGIERQAIKAGAIFGGEGFKLVERPFLVKDGGVTFKRERRVENAGAAARRFFRVCCMGRRVCAQKEFGRARRRRERRPR